MVLGKSNDGEVKRRIGDRPIFGVGMWDLDVVMRIPTQYTSFSRLYN